MFNDWESSVEKSMFHSLAFVGQVHFRDGADHRDSVLCVCVSECVQCPEHTTTSTRHQLSSWAFIALVKFLSLSLSVFLSPKSGCVTV